jgi:heme-degrading monooxygenase HmoA
MYAVIRKFNKMRSVEEAARRAEAGLAPILRQSPGFQGYYVVNGGNDVGLSITLFDTQDAVQEAQRRAMAWIKDNLGDLYEGEPDVTTGEVLVSVTGQGAMAA